MEERSYLVLSFVAIILGALGFGVGIYSVINFQVIEGPQGQPGISGRDGLNGIDGINGTDGQDALGGITVGIIDPDYGNIISGCITIRAIVFGSENYTISILRNGSEIGTLLPYVWNSSSVVDGLWNITVIATDNDTNTISWDTVLVITQNHVVKYVNIMPNLIIPENTQVYYSLSAESIVHLPNSFTNSRYCIYRFLIPENYVSTENIIFHIVWGSSVFNPTIDYGITFHYASDGNPGTTFDGVQSSWTGSGQGRRNFETIVISNQYISPGNLLMVRVYMEDQAGLDPTFCYAVWCEVPVD